MLQLSHFNNRLSPSTAPGLSLRTVLSLYPNWVQPSSGMEALGNSGGMSGCTLWRFMAGRRVLLLRRWPDEWRDSGRLDRIHGWLSELSSLAYVPVPIPTRDGRTHVSFGGHLWQLEPWMPGTPSDATTAEERITAVFRSLACIHQRLARFGETRVSPGLAARLEEARWLDHRGLLTLTEAVHRADPSVERDLALAWLSHARGAIESILEPLRFAATDSVFIQPCLRDARPVHFLFTGNRLTGLVDFGGMGVDSVAADLARLLSEWLGEDRFHRRMALDAYSTIRPLTATETSLIEIFERSGRILAPGRWIRWHFVENRRFDHPDAVRAGLARGLRHMQVGLPR